MNTTQSEISEDILQAEQDHDQYLTFMLADEEYGIDILRVQEIRGWENATPIPNMPSYVLGVVNLRGTVVPIIDLRRHFKIENFSFGKETVVIVVKITDQTEAIERTMGIVVDAVSEVHNISATQLKPAPKFGGVLNTDAIKGLATTDKQMIIILDIDELMNNSVLQQLDTKQ